eukprot:evm.model.NODE_30192_length_15016_cov_32.601490.1
MGNAGSGNATGGVLAPTSSVVIEGHALRVKSCLGETVSRASTVYLAEDEARRKFAIKVLRVLKGDVPSNHAAEMELEHHANLPLHPHVVTYIGSRVDHHQQPSSTESSSSSSSGFNLYYLLTEYCPTTVRSLLDDAIRRKEPIAERDILNIFTSAAAALIHLHSHGLAHRDIKIENLLFSSEANGQRVKLCDLSSCSSDHISLRNSTEISYAEEDIDKHTTLAYRSPEQVDLYSKKSIGPAVDIWALGVLLYTLCWWRTPFEDKAGAVQPMAILNCNYAAPPSLPIPGTNGQQSFPAYSPGILTLLRVCLEPDPEQRMTASQVLDQVRELMAAGEIGRHADLPALTPFLSSPPPRPLGRPAFSQSLSAPSPSASPSPLVAGAKKSVKAGGEEEGKQGPGEEDFIGLFDANLKWNSNDPTSTV